MHIVTRTLSANTSLDYVVDTKPFPLQASPTDPDLPYSVATLTLVASNPKNAPVALESVTLSFDVAPANDADDGTYLTSIGSGIGFMEYRDPGHTTWACTDDGNGNLTATAVAGSVPIAGQGLGLVVSNIQPNRGVGTFTLTITETVAGEAPTETQIEISKFPAEFSLDNFRADTDQVGQGLGTILRWDDGRGATLTIFYAGTSADVTGTNSWPTPALTENTEFMLQASIGDVALATWSMTIQVSGQILALTSLAVAQGSTLSGAVSAGSTLSVAGPLTAQGGAAVTGALAATGAVSGASLQLGGWTLSADSSNNLHFTSPGGAVVTFDNEGDLILPANLGCQGQIGAVGSVSTQAALSVGGTIAAGGIITTNGARVISTANVIWLGNSYGFLNGTTKQGGPGDGWEAVAYWQGDNPPDGDSNLSITIVS